MIEISGSEAIANVVSVGRCVVATARMIFARQDGRDEKRADDGANQDAQAFLPFFRRERNQLSFCESLTLPDPK
jgi:hypothetical protein